MKISVFHFKHPPIILSLLRPQLEKAATQYQNKATFEEHCRKIKVSEQLPVLHKASAKKKLLGY